MPLPEMKPHKVTCSHCGDSWVDSHPDAPGAAIWCGKCDRSKPAKPNEKRAAELRAACRAGDGKPEGTRESLERCATMLDTYGPEHFPANELGQVHFVRAMMESVSDEIRAYLEATKSATGN